MDCRPLRTALYFEELEPRLLYSADLVGVDTEVPEQDAAEEPAITADLDGTSQSDDTVALPEDDEGGAVSSGPMEPAEELEGGAGDAGTVEETGAPAETSGTGPADAADAHNPHSGSDTDSGGHQDNSADESGEEAEVPMAGGGEAENVAPVLTQPDGPFDYAGGDPAVLIAPAATVADADSDNFFKGTLTVSITEGASNDDQLLIVEGGDVSIVGNSNIKVEGKLVGRFAGGSDCTALVISWTPQTTPGYAEAVLRQIGFSNSSDEPASGSRTVDFVLTDGDGGTSNTVQSIVDVTGGIGAPGDDPGENIAPVLTQPGGPVEYGDGDPAVLIAPAATVIDVDSADFKQGTLSVSFSQGVTGDDQLLIVAGGDVSIAGNSNIKVEDKLVGHFAGGLNGTTLVISWTPQATPAYAEAVLRQIGYSNSSAEPAPGSRTVDFVLTDGDGGISNTVQAVINITDDSGEPPGGDPGEGGTGGGEVTPPIDQDETSKQVASGSDDQKIPGGKQEQDPSGNDGSGTLTPPLPPALDSPQGVEYGKPGGSGADSLAATDNWLDQPDSTGEVREKDDPAKDDQAAQAERTLFFAAANRIASESGAPRPDGSAGYDKADEGSAFSLPEQPAAIAAQGQGAGDVPHEATLSEMLKTTMGRLLSFLGPSAATAAPAASLDSDPVGTGDTPANNEMVCREVEVMRQEMEEAFLQSNQAGKMMVYTTTGASLSLFAGIARYFFGTGTLLSGFLATIPLWKGFDPVAILSTPKNDRKNAGATSPSTDVETVDHKAETMFAAGGDA